MTISRSLLLLLSLPLLASTQQYTARTWPAATVSTEKTTFVSDADTSPLLLLSKLLSHGGAISESADVLNTILAFNDAHETASLTSRISNPSPASFPEHDALTRLTSGKTNTAVCFSGGGSRSYIASAGYTQALRDLGLWSSVKYAAGISGGKRQLISSAALNSIRLLCSQCVWPLIALTAYAVYANFICTCVAGNWFLNSLSYRDPKFDTDVYLGPILPPANNTFDNLKTMPKHCMRANAGRHFTLDMITAMLEGNDPAEDWIQGVFDVYLKPAGNSFHAPYALDAIEALKIIKNNPDASLRLADFNLVTDPVNEPFPIVGITLIGPVELAPLHPTKRTYTLIESTPVATGVSHEMGITSTARNGSSMDIQTGGFIDSMFFGTRHVSSTSSTTVVEASEGRGLWSLEQSAAASSVAPEAFFSLTTNRLADVLGFKADYFQASATAADTASTRVLLGDGGSVENVSLIPMLKRGVKKIVLFLNFEDPLASKNDYDPFVRLPREVDIESLIPQYFGIPAIPASIVDWFDFFGEEFNKNKVFRTFHYPFLVRKLQEAQATGNGAVATMKLRTVDNEWWGVKGGMEVEVTWVYLSKSETFVNMLPDDVKETVATGDNEPQNLPPDGPFKGFPHFGTAGADINGEQSNLLANYCGWVVKQNEKLFRAALE